MRPQIVQSAPASQAERRDGGSSRWLNAITLVLSAVAICAFAASGLLESPRAFDPLVTAVLVLLAVGATQREAIFGDETAINASIIVLAAAVGTSVAGRPIWTAGVCGLAAGLHWAHIRDRALRKLIVNSACTSLGALSAAAIGKLVVPAGVPDWLASAVAGGAAVLAYWIVDNALIAMVLTVAERSSFRTHASELIRSETGLLPYALVGFLSGYFLIDGVGVWAGALAVVALIVVAEWVIFRGVVGGLGIERFVVICVAVITIATSATVVAIADTAPDIAILAALVAVGLVSGYLCQRCRFRVSAIAIVAVSVAGVFVLRHEAPYFGALVAGLATGAPLLLTRKSRLSSAVLGSAVCLAAIAAAAVVTVVPAGFVSSPGALVVGVGAAGAGLVAWHLCLGAAVVASGGKAVFRTVISLLNGDLALFALAGLVGGLTGWISDSTPAGGLFALCLGLLVVNAVAGRDLVAPTQSRTVRQADPELLEVVRSAVLNLPPSQPGR